MTVWWRIFIHHWLNQRCSKRWPVAYRMLGKHVDLLAGAACLIDQGVVHVGAKSELEALILVGRDNLDGHLALNRH